MCEGVVSENHSSSVSEHMHLTYLNNTVTKINWLTLFKEIIPVYNENHTKPINKK
jgi:hypothetical protein